MTLTRDVLADVNRRLEWPVTITSDGGLQQEAERLAVEWRVLYEALKAQRFTTLETLQLMSAYLNGGARR